MFKMNTRTWFSSTCSLVVTSGDVKHQLHSSHKKSEKNCAHSRIRTLDPRISIKCNVYECDALPLSQVGPYVFLRIKCLKWQKIVWYYFRHMALQAGVLNNIFQDRKEGLGRI